MIRQDRNTRSKEKLLNLISLQSKRRKKALNALKTRLAKSTSKSQAPNLFARDYNPKESLTVRNLQMKKTKLKCAKTCQWKFGNTI